jgi:hypothetical protein
MSGVATAVGVLLLVGVTAGLILMPRLDGLLAPFQRLGRGARRWWVLGLTAAVPIWVGVGASLSTSESRPFGFLLVAGVLVPLLLACAWAWARARSFS